MKIEITRETDQTIETKGKLIVLNDAGANVFQCVTLELPYKNNASQISCIPAGSYICKKVSASHIPYKHISVTNVPNRDGICIHCGNYAALTILEIQEGKHPDILGCVLTGNGFADINHDGILDIFGSHDAFTKLMKVLPDENEFLLTIK
jgi:hypothetical protein